MVENTNAITNSMILNVKDSANPDQNDYDFNQNDIELRRTFLEQKEKKDRELGTIISGMKEKMDQGRQSKASQFSSNNNSGDNNPFKMENNDNFKSHLFGNNIGVDTDTNNNFLVQSNENINLNNNANNGFFLNNNNNSVHSSYNNNYNYNDDNNNNNININNSNNNLLVKSNHVSKIMNDSNNFNNGNLNIVNNPINISNRSSNINFDNNNFNNGIINNNPMILSNHNSKIFNNNNDIQNINMPNNFINTSNHNSLVIDNNLNNNNDNINLNNINNINNNMMNCNISNMMSNNDINMMDINNNNNMMNNFNMNDNNNMINNINMNNSLNVKSININENKDDNINNDNNMNNNFLNENNDMNDDNNDILNEMKNININPNDNISKNKNSINIINENSSKKNTKILDNNISNSSNTSRNQIKPINTNANYNNNIFPTPISNFDKKEQEKRDTMKKSEIIERHSQMTSFYDYTPGETDGELIKLLEDINYFGEISKNEIQKQKTENPNKFISLEDAEKMGKKTNLRMKNFKNEYFILSILAKALMSHGCLVVIEKDEPKTEEENKEINTTLQFLVNGMYNFKKYIFHFDFGNENNKILLKDTKKQGHFNRYLKQKLMQLFNLQVNEIIMTNPRVDFYFSITAIIKKAYFNELSEDNLYQELINDETFNKIKEVEKSILLSGCKLNPHMLDSRGNNKDGGWGLNETRGGYPYFPPKGWSGYGLRVLDRYDYGDNSWLDYHNYEGEWAVAYHGIGYGLRGNELLFKINNLGFDNIKTGILQKFKDLKDCFSNEGKNVGEGVYVTPQPAFLDDYCGIFDYDGKKYKIAFMTRVKPGKIRCPEEKDDYWVINGTDNEIRPYRILIKEVNN